MRKLRVGIWMNKTIAPEAGGGFGYYQQLIKCIAGYRFQKAEVIFMSDVELPVIHPGVPQVVIRWRPYQKTKWQYFTESLTTFFGVKRIAKKHADSLSAHEQILKKELSQHVDLIYYPTVECIYPAFPYIYTIWDLGHISTYAFPELSMNLAYEKRNGMINLFSHKALMIFAESAAGKKAIVQYLNIQPDRIKIIPLFASGIIESHVIPRMPDQMSGNHPFIHYPAQFWAHKNHYNLLIAFKEVRKSFPLLKLVLTGTDKGNKKYISQQIKELELSEVVIDAGFVALEELKWLYKNSKGLVMPSFLGPTNMPLLESAFFQCPVACSKLEGHFEQLGEYGYYFQPDRVDEMADAIIQMLRDQENGIRKEPPMLNTVENSVLAIDQAFSALQPIRFCWGDEDAIF